MTALGNFTPEQVTAHLADVTLAEVRRLVGIGELAAGSDLISAQTSNVLRAVAARVTPPGVAAAVAGLARQHGWTVRHEPGPFLRGSILCRGWTDWRSRMITLGREAVVTVDETAAHELAHQMLHGRPPWLGNDVKEREARAVEVLVMRGSGSRATNAIERLGGEAAAEAACQSPRVQRVAQTILGYVAAEQQVRELVDGETSRRPPT